MRYCMGGEERINVERTLGKAVQGETPTEQKLCCSMSREVNLERGRRGRVSGGPEEFGNVELLGAVFRG